MPATEARREWRPRSWRATRKHRGRKSTLAQRRDLESADRMAATQRPHADFKSLPWGTAVLLLYTAKKRSKNRRDGGI